MLKLTIKVPDVFLVYLILAWNIFVNGGWNTLLS